MSASSGPEVPKSRPLWTFVVISETDFLQKLAVEKKTFVCQYFSLISSFGCPCFHYGIFFPEDFSAVISL